MSKLSLTLVSQTEPPELIFPVRVDTCVIQNHVWTESLQQPGEVSLHCGSSDMLVSSRAVNTLPIAKSFKLRFSCNVFISNLFWHQQIANKCNKIRILKYSKWDLLIWLWTHARILHLLSWPVLTCLWRGTPCLPAHLARWYRGHSVVYGGGSFSHSAQRM